MQIHALNVEGFGTLAQYKLSDLGEGLNVIHGGNGSGKSTLLHFLRGVLCGYGEARRLRLIPPLKGGQPGGSLTVSTPNGRFDVIRHARPDQSDTLAIHPQNTGSDAIAPLRKWISGLDADRLRTIFAVSSYEAHDLDALVRQAISDQIDLSTHRSSSNWVDERLEALERDRRHLLTGGEDRTPVSVLERQLRDLDQQIARELEQDFHQMSQWQRSLQQLNAELDRLHRQVAWLGQEIQAVESDLTEVQTRLWSTRHESYTETRTVEVEQQHVEPDWPEEIARLDREITNAQQVLRDLAASRMSLSVRKAELTGSEVPDQDKVFDRQRHALEQIESQSNKLEEVVLQLRDRRNLGRCVCEPMSEQVATTLEVIRSQVWLLCQELSRLQTGYSQSLIVDSRNSVDQCEFELIRQIQRLRLRRDELVHDASRKDSERVIFRTKHESAFCECADHDGSLTYLPAPAIERPKQTELIQEQVTVKVSDARPGDANLERSLIPRRQELRRKLWESQQQIARIRRERDELSRKPRIAFESSQLAKLRYERGVVEQQLADAREQWESLALLKATLLRTRDSLQSTKASPVVEEASSLLRRMTNDRYVRFQYVPDHHELRVVNHADAELRAEVLSRGTLEQATLCFRLALWNEYRRQGIDLPLILDDVLADSDENRLRAAATVLLDQANRHQIILMTCQEHLVSMFEDMGIRTKTLPGTQRTARAKTATESRVVRFTEPAPATVTRAETVSRPPIAPEPVVPQPVIPRPVETQPAVVVDRVQPDQPYWLSPESSVSHVPSLGSQMARRLGAIGVTTVGDLIELDLESTELPLDSLQISARTLREWKAEARLLCCVPQLTGRDAQLLVAIGILHPTELAQADAEELLGRVRRFRTTERSELALAWLRDNLEWPSRSQVEEWIRRGRSARSYRSARGTRTRDRFYTSRNDGQRGSSPTYRERVRTERTDRPRHDRSSDSGMRLMSQSTSRSSSSGNGSSGTGSSSRTSSGNGQSAMGRQTWESYTSTESNGERTWRFFLDLDSPVVDAPSIGPKTAERLERIGISTVRQLLGRDAREVANRLNRRHITEEVVVAWQQQANLMCQVPELRGHDVQILVACGFTEPTAVASMTPRELFSIVEPVATSKEGQRLLRSSKTPDLEEVTEWIEYARHSRPVKAA